jgi:signal transduction histidine kinase
MNISNRLQIIALSIAVVAVLLIGGIGLSALRYMIRLQEADMAERARLELQHSVENRAAANEALAAALARLPEVQALVRASDRPGLLTELGDAFALLQKYGINNTHIHRANITTLVRLHAPAQFDDDLTALRPMIVQVQQTQQPLRGIERGVNGLPIRGAVPIRDNDGTRLGVIEVGSFLGSDFLTSLEQPGTAYSIYAFDGDRLRLLSRSMQPHASPLSDALLRGAMTGAAAIRHGSGEDSNFLSTATPLLDYRGQPIGVVQIDIDTAAQEAAFDRVVQIMLATTVAVILLALLGTAVAARPILRRLDRLIRATTAVAEDQPVSVPMLQRPDEFGRFARAIEKFRLSRAELDEARQKSEAASIAKSNFLAVMSHELRTPLNAIIGFSDLMLLRRAQHKADPEREDEYLRDILNSAAHLMSLVDDILTNSSIESGGLKIQPEAVNLTVELANTIRLMQPRARDARLTLELIIPDGLPPVWLDPRALRQICLNLMANAMRFTPAGGKVQVEARIVDDRLEIAVADTGPGIPDKHLQRVTEAFYQVAGAQTRASSSSGVGLGLTIAQRLARLQDGDLTLANRPEGGLVVTLRCPAHSARAMDHMRATTASVA